MIKLILKANKWYDNMKDVNRTLFFFFVLLPIIGGLQYFIEYIFNISESKSLIIWAFTMLVLVLFRMTPVIFELFSKKN